MKSFKSSMSRTLGLCVAAIMCSSQVSFGQAMVQPLFRPASTIFRAAGRITIDGKLSDPGWAVATQLDNFVERFPGENTQPQVNTKVLIAFDENRLYVAFICQDDPSAIRATMCQRDQFSGDDAICVLVDTYGDGSWAYELFVNAYGIQKDQLWTKIAGEDYGYDFIWESAGRITDSGYQVELAIPFASLRFPDKEIQTWKMDFWRNHPRESFRQYSWAAYDRNEQCWTCQWGTVDGIKGIHPGSKGVEILPALVASQSGSMVPVNSFKNNKARAEASLAGKYTISSDITAEAAVNPDFSQIEADATQIDVNTTIALMYPERRPYFQEGSDLFRTLFNSFYTRTINDPQFTAKLTGRREGLSVGFLTAYDRNTPYMIPLDESSILVNSGKSLANVLRGLKTFGNNSQVGFILTDRRFDGGGSGTVFAIDDNVRLTGKYSIDGQYIITYTKESKDSALSSDLTGITFGRGKHTAAFDGESFWGNALITRLRRDARNWNFMIDYDHVSPSYRTETGYDPWVNYRQLSVFTSYNIYLQEGILERIAPQMFAEGRWNYDGARRRRYINVGFESEMRIAQAFLSAAYRTGTEIWMGKEFRNLWMYDVDLGSVINDRIRSSIDVQYGRDIARWLLVKGKSTSILGAVTLKPMNRLVIEPTFNYLSSFEVNSNEKLFQGYIARVRTQFQATRELSLRLVVQYDDFGQSWDVDPLLTYRLSPFSVFYVGSAHDFSNLSSETQEPPRWRLTARQYFMKLQYLFRS